MKQIITKSYSLETEPDLYDSKNKRLLEEVDKIDRKFNSLILDLEKENSKLLATMQFDCCIQDAIKDSTLLSSEGEMEKTLSSIIKIYDDTQFDKIDSYKKKCCHIQDLLCDQQQKRLLLMRGTPADIKETAVSIKKKSKKIVYKIGEILRRNGYAKIEVVAHARIALVKFRDPSQSIDIDLTLNGKLALHNSDLIKAFLSADSTGTYERTYIIARTYVQLHFTID
jgi:hypothetical protein